MENNNVLITGASSGIGLELARQFAKHGHRLVITAPVQQELDLVAHEFRNSYRAEVHAIAADIADEEGLDSLVQQVEGLGISVDILVNNAGKGARGKFWEIAEERDDEMIALNVRAVTALTKRFLPQMIQRGRGRILNTASVAGFEPGPLLAVYHATKAFVLSLSEALATELDGTGITVTALCPGPVDTDFFPKADMVETRAFQKANVMPPQEVAKVGYEALMRGERVIVPGAVNKAMVFSRRMLPESAQAKKNQKYYEDVKPEDMKRVPGEIAMKHGDDAAENSADYAVGQQDEELRSTSRVPSVNSLRGLLVEELRDLLDAEKQLTNALPKLAKAATHEELKTGLGTHLQETEIHVERLEEVFQLLGEAARSKTCAAMKGLVEEGSEAIEFEGPDNLRDAKLIGAAQRVEHYEIAAYGTARAFAEAIGESDVVDLLQQTLDEEGATDKKLTALAATINQEALAPADLGQYDE